MQFDEEDESQFTPKAQTGDTPTTDATCKPEIFPKTLAQIYADSWILLWTIYSQRKCGPAWQQKTSYSQKYAAACKQETRSATNRTALTFIFFGATCMLSQVVFASTHWEYTLNNNRIRNCINTPNPKKQQIAERFSWLISRIGKSKNHTVKLQFHKIR